MVNSTEDSHDANPGDGVVSDHILPDSARCTFRAAIEEASSLTGPDTIIVPGNISPVKLHLGPVVIEDDRTVILGQDNRPAIDGLNNPFNSSSLVLLSDSNVVQGLTFRRSRGHGIAIMGVHNRIGGDGSEEANVFRGNGLDNDQAAAVNIRGATAIGNTIAGNLIGLYGNGTLVDGNTNGIRIEQDASGNIIGGSIPGQRNVVSGNERYGIVLTGNVCNNHILGNFIGPDVSGDIGPGNTLGGILAANGAHDNDIGGENPEDANLISANGGHGVVLSGRDVRTNFIRGNLVGTDISGRMFLANAGDGVLLRDGAHHNVIGDTEAGSGNVISGNQHSGVHISGTGTDENIVAANLIGVDIRGYSPRGNGWIDGDGILIDSGASGNHIGGGGQSEGNTVSGNYRFGVHITGAGTDNNWIRGNFIGVNALGTSSVFNSAGVVISEGAGYNIVGGSTQGERNILSGNRAELFPYGAGVLIYGPGSDHNRVLGNYIGLDVSGTRALRNGSAGVIIGDGAQANIIGGELDGETNVISGNGVGSVIPGAGRGIHLFGASTRLNKIIGNTIGLAADGDATVANSGNGIGLYASASENQIGGDTPSSGNTISGNELHGIYLSGAETRSNRIRYNRITNNDSLGIALRDAAQDGIAPPGLTVLSLPSPTQIDGLDAPPGATVDIYEADPDPSGAGEGARWLGSGVADESGNFHIVLSESEVGDWVTATVTDSIGNTSQFAANISGSPTAVEPVDSRLPLTFSLSQNYPNPFNPGTTIRFTLARSCEVDLAVFNELGQTVTTLVRGVRPAGKHTIDWDGTDQAGRPVASGVYFYRISTNTFTSSRKMLLLK